LKHLGGVLFGEHAIRLPNTSFFAFPHIDGETLVVALDRAGFALASGSACSSASTEASATLLAMGVEAQLAKGAIRISLGKDNTPRQVEDFLKHLSVEVQRLGKMAALAV
jgi:cysteine desulfurase